LVVEVGDGKVVPGPLPGEGEEDVEEGHRIPAAGHRHRHPGRGWKQVLLGDEAGHRVLQVVNLGSLGGRCLWRGGFLGHVATTGSERSEGCVEWWR
jgi:hypothetical protein